MKQKTVHPNAQITFPKGDYAYALGRYLATKSWCESSGILFKHGISGLMESPTFLGQKSPSPIPPDWLDTPEWEFVMFLHIDGITNLNWFKDRIAEIPLPQGAQLLIEAARKS